MKETLLKEVLSKGSCVKPKIIKIIVLFSETSETKN